MRLFHKILHQTGVLVLEENHLDDTAPRVLFYCASNIGLGHLGRVLLVMRRLKTTLPQANLLLATDAPSAVLAAQANDLAVVRLPAFAFLEDGSFDERPFAIDLEKRQWQVLRQNLLLALLHSFRPHVLYADTLPHGKRDELLPALRHLQLKDFGKAILVMRDIPAGKDEPFKFTDPAKAEKALRYYERILIAGDQAFFDPAAEYNWPESLRAKTRHLGFVVPRQHVTLASRQHVALASRRHVALASRRHRIVAAFGGGWEAAQLSRVVIEAAARVQQCRMGLAPCCPSDLHLTIFTGPAATEEQIAELRATAPPTLALDIARYSAQFSDTLAAADLAILQAGSTVFQVLETDMPLLVYYRAYKDREQELRARLLERHPGIQVLEKDTFTVDTLVAAIKQALASSPAPRQTGYAFDGVENAVEEIVGMVRK